MKIIEVDIGMTKEQINKIDIYVGYINVLVAIFTCISEVWKHIPIKLDENKLTYDEKKYILLCIQVNTSPNYIVVTLL